MATDTTTATSLRDQINTFVRHTQLCFQGYQLFQIAGEALGRQHRRQAEEKLFSSRDDETIGRMQKSDSDCRKAAASLVSVGLQLAASLEKSDHDSSALLLFIHTVGAAGGIGVAAPLWADLKVSLQRIEMMLPVDDRADDKPTPLTADEQIAELRRYADEAKADGNTQQWSYAIEKFNKVHPILDHQIETGDKSRDRVRKAIKKHRIDFPEAKGGGRRKKRKSVRKKTTNRSAG